MLNIIKSGSRTWALAAADGELHVYCREEAGEWNEVLLSEDSEQIDPDGSAILEALHEQYATTDENDAADAPQAEDQESEDDAPEDDEPEDDEEDPEGEAEPPEDDEEEPPEEDEEPTDEEEDEKEQEKKPRRSRARTRAKKK